MGQDSDTLSDYKFDVLDQDISMPRPGGFTIYTPLKIFPPEVFFPGFEETPINSLLSSGNWGDNEHNLTRSMSEYPNSAIAIGLDLKDAVDLCGGRQPLRAIAATGDDDVIELTPQYHAVVDQMIELLKDTNRPVFLRIGYEFDGPWNCYEPELYKTTFKFIKERINALDATNIATVWQSAGFFFDDFLGRIEYSASEPGHLDRWYPGDEFVDWVSISTFLAKDFTSYQAPGTEDFIGKEPRILQNEMVEFARKHNKPLMLAEASPQGFSTGSLTSSPIFIRLEQSISAEELWNAWHLDWFNFIEENKDVVRAVAYINANWNEAPLWRCDAGAQTEPGEAVFFDPSNPTAPICPGGTFWGDARVQANDEILNRFKSELQKDIYVNGGKGFTLPNTIINETTFLGSGDQLDFKLLVDTLGDIKLKLYPSKFSNGMLKISLAGESKRVRIKGPNPVYVHFKDVDRNQENLNIKLGWGRIKINTLKAKLEKN